MTRRTWRVIDWLYPVLLAASYTYGTQVIEATKGWGGWWATGGAVLIVVGRALYQWQQTKPKPYG